MSLDVRILVFADKYKTNVEVVIRQSKAPSGTLYIEDLIFLYIYLIYIYFLLF